MTTIGKYKLIEELGRGAFGVVYRAHDEVMAREVALKVVQTPALVADPAFVARFEQEAKRAAGLHHANIVTVYEYGEESGMLFLAMRLLTGQTLDDYLATDGPLTLAQALPLLTQLASALDHLQAQQLVHRDVKPANVMVDSAKEMSVTLMDFGLVRSLAGSVALTKTADSMVGTLAYLAPEQIEPQLSEVSPLTDVYALGVVAYEMLVGQTPFVGTVAAVLNGHLQERPLIPAGIDAAVGAILQQALAKQPAERYASAGDFVAALQAIMDEQQQTATNEATLTTLLVEARQAREAEKWLQLQALAVQIMQIERTHNEALAWMREALTALQQEQALAAEQAQVTVRYHEGVEALANKEWRLAVEAFEAVLAQTPDFPEAQAQLHSAKEGWLRAQWYEKALAFEAEARWGSACWVWLWILEADRDYRDGEALTHFLGAVRQFWAKYERQKATLKQTRKQLRHYDKISSLTTATEQQDWEAILVEGKAILQLIPDLEWVRTWVERAERELAKTAVGQASADVDSYVDEKSGLTFVRIPAGPFLYGENKEERTLPEFWMSKTPVTNEQYAKFVADAGHRAPEYWQGQKPPKEKATHPVVQVSWEDAQAYAAWMGATLPTEEAWEKAARSGDGRAYPWGDGWQEDHCNTKESGIGDTTPVGHYSPKGDSPYGCVDMSGNVWEWTASWYDDKKARRVVRGGSWAGGDRYARAAARDPFPPDGRLNGVGFRLVQVAPS